MKLRFNGMYAKVRTGGCHCNGGSSGKVSFQMSRTLILPSTGRDMSFHYGNIYEVAEEDGKFLLQYTYTDKEGMIFHAFTEEK